MPKLHTSRPFTIRPVILNAADDKRATFYTATCNYLYLTRAPAGDDIRGATPDFSVRGDLAALGRGAPLRADSESYHGQRLWQTADRHAQDQRPSEPVAWHAVGSLPVGFQMSNWRATIDAFIEDRLVTQGMIVDWAIHARDETAEQPGVLPHCHMLITARAWDLKRRAGMVMPTWLRSHASRREHALAWYELTKMYPAAGYELRPEAD